MDRPLCPFGRNGLVERPLAARVGGLRRAVSGGRVRRSSRDAIADLLPWRRLDPVSRADCQASILPGYASEFGLPLDAVVRPHRLGQTSLPSIARRVVRARLGRLGRSLGAGLPTVAAAVHRERGSRGRGAAFYVFGHVHAARQVRLPGTDACYLNTATWSTDGRGPPGGRKPAGPVGRTWVAIDPGQDGVPPKGTLWTWSGGPEPLSEAVRLCAEGWRTMGRERSDEAEAYRRQDDPHHVRRRLLAGLPVVLVLAAGATFCGPDPYDPPKPPDQIRLSWTGDPHTSMTVVWHASRSEGAALQVWDDMTTWRLSGARTGGQPSGPGVWFRADVRGLRPGANYRYAIESGGTRTPTYQFRTEPSDPRPVRFDVFADQGDCFHYGAACRVMEGIARDRPDFVLGCGDLTLADDNGPKAAETWGKDLVRYYSTWAPLLPTPGDHEYAAGDNIGNYRRRFALPGQATDRAGTTGGNGDYYSFDYGPVHLVALPELYTDMKPGSRFQQWLEDDLRRAAANPKISWRVAFGHRAFYSTGGRHGSSHTYLNRVRPVLEKYHIDLVFSGHERNYERTLPMLDDEPAAANPTTWRKGVGITYVVTGGGGSTLYDDFGSAEPWDAARQVVHEHVSVEIDSTGKTLRLTAFDDDNSHQPFDHFLITSVG